MLNPEKDVSNLKRWQSALKDEFEERNNEEVPKSETCEHALKLIDFFKKIGGELLYVRPSADLTICMKWKIADRYMQMECDDEGCGLGIEGDLDEKTGSLIYYDLILK